MKKSLIVKILLIGFFFFSLFLHFYQLGTSPKSVLVDEAANAYDAYSLATTGADQYGTPYPLLFKSFGDQKLPLYIYSSVLPVKVFGLSALSIRFVAAMSMSLLIFIVFLLLQELEFDEITCLLGAGITSVASWTFVLARFGWESSLGLLLFLTALLFAIKAMRKQKSLYFIITGLVLGITWYSYIPYRLITIFITGFFLLLAKSGIKQKILFLSCLLLLITPSLPSLLSPAGSARFKQTSIIYDPVNSAVVNDRRIFCNEFTHQQLCTVIINKPIEITFTILTTLGSVFSTNYLFVSSDSDGPHMNIRHFALFPIFLTPFYLLGLVFLYIKRKNYIRKRELIFLGLTLLACCIPVAVTKSPVREQTSYLYPFILLLIIFGYTLFHSEIKNKLWTYALFVGLFIYGCLLLFFSINVTYRRNFGNEDFIANTSYYLAHQYDKVTNIYIDPGFTDFLIFYAFYNKIDPKFYQKNIQLGQVDNGGFQHTEALGKLKITHEDVNQLACDAKKKNENDLYLINHDISKDRGRTILPIFTGQEPDQLVYGYVYKLSDIVTSNDCATLQK